MLALSPRERAVEESSLLLHSTLFNRARFRIGLPGEQEPLGGSTLEKELGFEQSLCEPLLAGRTGLGIELRSGGAPMRQNWVIPSAG